MATEHILIHGNCKNPAQIPDESVQLVVTSPPYFNVIDYADQKEGNIGNTKEGKLPYEGYLKEMRIVYEQCFRVLKWGGFIVSNIADVISNTEKYPLSYDHFYLLRDIFGHNGYQDTIVWQKPSGMSSQKRFGVFIQNNFPYYYRPNNMYEPCIIFVKGKREYTERCKQFPIDWEKMKKYQSDIWQMQPETQVVQKGLHEAPFPLELPKTFIKFFTCPGDYVYDPFMGSGTTMMASQNLGRNCWGCELEDKHIETIKLRTGFLNGMRQGDWIVNLGQDKFKVIKGQVLLPVQTNVEESLSTITPPTHDSEPLVLCDEQLSVQDPVQLGKEICDTFFPETEKPKSDWKTAFGSEQPEEKFVDPIDTLDDDIVLAPLESDKIAHKRESYEQSDSSDWDCTDCGESFTVCSQFITTENGLVDFQQKCKFCQSNKIKKVFP
jgi:modification methylase